MAGFALNRIGQIALVVADVDRRRRSIAMFSGSGTCTATAT